MLSLLGCQLTGRFTGGLSDVDRIVAKHIEATGGREAQEAIKSMTQKGGAYIAAAGVQADVVMYYKNGNQKTVMEIPGMGKVVQGVTGGIAWQSFLGDNSILQGDAAALMRDGANPNPLLNWKETYESAEITGEENGATVVVFATRGGTTTTRYFDNTSGLLTKQVQTDPSGNSLTTTSSSSLTNTFTDYKEVGDIMQAHKVGVDAVEAQFEITFTSMELNAQIDDSTFDLPDAIKALLPG
jgi:hypothetical protein